MTWRRMSNTDMTPRKDQITTNLQNISTNKTTHSKRTWKFSYSRVACPNQGLNESILRTAGYADCKQWKRPESTKRSSNMLGICTCHLARSIFKVISRVTWHLNSPIWRQIIRRQVIRRQKIIYILSSKLSNSDVYSITLPFVNMIFQWFNKNRSVDQKHVFSGDLISSSIWEKKVT